MANSFTAKVELYNGALQACKVCSKTGNIGDDIFVQNIGDESNKVWIRCVDKECFTKQGGTLPDKSKKPYYQKKVKTTEQRLEICKIAGPVLRKLADEQTREAYPDLKDVTAFSIKSDVQFKGLVEMFKVD
jgi:hypothetical protein